MATRLGVAKDATLKALQARKAIKNGDFTPFIPALAFAVAKDFFLDILSEIPIAGLVPWAFSLFITVYLFVFLFGKGKWKVRIVVFILGLFDAVPLVIGIFPLSTVAVLYAYYQAKKHADQAKIDLASLGSQSNAEMIREYQRARAEAAVEEEERTTEIVQGGAMLAADMTGIGEVARLGKVGMMAAKLGEHKAVQAMGRRAMREGAALSARGKERSDIQKRYSPAHNVV